MEDEEPDVEAVRGGHGPRAIVLQFPYDENLRVVREDKLVVLQVYWGDFPRGGLKRRTAPASGSCIWCAPTKAISSLQEAAKAIEAGVDGIIVQGQGGGCSGRTIFTVAKSSRSCFGLWHSSYRCWGNCRWPWLCCRIGTWCSSGLLRTYRFLATEGSFAHPIYKEKVIEMSHADYTNVFGRTRWSYTPQRGLEATLNSGWKKLADQETEENQPIIGQSIIHGMHYDIHRFGAAAPNATATGDIGSMVMYAGQGVGPITEIIPAGEVVRRLVTEAKNIIRERLSDFQ